MTAEVDRGGGVVDLVRIFTYAMSQKTSRLWLAITLTHVNSERILMFLGRNATSRVSNQKTLYYATSNNSCFCITGQNGKHENSIFHSM